MNARAAQIVVADEEKIVRVLTRTTLESHLAHAGSCLVAIFEN
jgi:hypothetical protein